MRGQRSSSECASHGRIPGGEALHPSVFGQLGRQHSRSSKQGHHQRNHFSRRRTIDARSLLQAATANTTMDQGSEGTTENSRSCRSLALYSHIFSLSSHVRSRYTTPSKSRGAWSPLGMSGRAASAARSTARVVPGSAPRREQPSPTSTLSRPQRAPATPPAAAACPCPCPYLGCHGIIV